MQRLTTLKRVLRTRRGLAAVMGTLLAGALLAGMLLSTRSRPVTSEDAARESFAQSPPGDDVPDLISPDGTVHAGSTEMTESKRPVIVLADQLLVKFEDGTTTAVARDALADAGVEPESKIGSTGARVVEVPPEERAAALAELESDPAVEYAESDVVLQVLDTIPNDAKWSGQWGAQRIRAPAAWSITRGDSAVVIAVLDTGVTSGHPDLKGALVAGYDFVNNDSVAADDHGHGTSTAGVSAARTNNTSGIAGTCWTCAIMPVKVLGANGSGSTSTVARGIAWAADHGADVINLSLGSTGATQTLADAVDYATSKGVVVVAAAGNSGSTTRFYPAAYPNVVSVAGSMSSDNRYSWSNYGSWVRVAAPGCNLAPLLGGGYGNFCGTSSATPVVAGLVGLERALRPAATRAEIEKALTKTVVRVGKYVATGRVSADGALRSLGGTSSTSTGPATATFQGTLTPSTPRKVYRRTVKTGTVNATLTFSGAPRLTLAIVNKKGTTVKTVTGSSGLRTNASIHGQTLRLVVKGSDLRRTVRFTLRVTSPA
jgi:subtilisin family serine protease